MKLIDLIKIEYLVELCIHRSRRMLIPISEKLKTAGKQRARVNHTRKFWLSTILNTEYSLVAKKFCISEYFGLQIVANVNNLAIKNIK